MADIQREADLSAGAIYLYFKSKNEIILGIVRDILNTIGALIPEEPVLGEREISAPDVITGFLGMSERLNQERNVFPLALQVWAEAVRNPYVLESLQSDIRDVKGRIRRLIVACQERGLIGREVDPDALVMVMLGVAQGYIVQRSLIAETTLEQYVEGVEGLLLNAARSPVEAPDTN